MVVYKIKNPTPPPPAKSPPRKVDLDPVDQIAALKRLGEFKRQRRNREQGEQRQPAGGSLSPNDRKTVRGLIDQVNANLKKQGVLIHLVLVQDENGMSIDVYDCSDASVCEVVRDIVIDITELPGLLKSLEQETGILINTIS